MIAITHRRKRAVQRKNFPAMARKIKLTNDFRTQQGDHVGAFREKKARDDFFGYRGAAEHVTPCEDQNLLPGLRQVGSVDQAIVTATDDDHVVMLRHFAKAPST